MLTILGKNWWLVLLRGIAAVVFGLTALLIPRLTLLFLVILFGVYLLLDGILAVITGIRNRRHTAQWWVLLLEGLLGLGFGIAVLIWPNLSVLVLVYLAAAWAILTGILELITAIGLRKELLNEWMLGLTGILSLVLGVILFLQPASGIVAVSWLIGLYALLFGALLIILSFKLRSFYREFKKQK